MVLFFQILNFVWATPNSLLDVVIEENFISVFVFFNFYRHSFRGHAVSFVKRVFWTYIISAAVVALLLTIIQKCPWGVDNLLAIKRIIIVSFPAAMSGTLSDTIK